VKERTVTIIRVLQNCLIVYYNDYTIMKTFESEEKTLLALGLSVSETNVYMVMLQGCVKVKEIMQRSGMKRPSVYYALSQLEKRGLIGRLQVGEYNRWKVSSFDCLTDMLDKQKRELVELESSLDTFVANINTTLVSPDHSKVTYYEGRDSVERIVFNSLYCHSKHIKSIAPKHNFFFQAGPDYATRYVEERKSRGITTQNLWEELLEPKILQNSYQGVSEIKIMPKIMSGRFKTTIFLYDDKVMYIAPVESGYAVVFQSEDHFEMMSAIFDGIWLGSKTAFPKTKKS